MKYFVLGFIITIAVFLMGYMVGYNLAEGGIIYV